MPWTRLHAVKDYLDMVLILRDFPKIRQTFNIVPALIDQLEDYAYKNAQDKVSLLTSKNAEELSLEDKKYILENFFDANFDNLIRPHPAYLKLYKKLFLQNFSAENFSNQEFSDIMAWFNLVWFDPYWVENNPDIKALFEKQEGYTTADRIKIIEIQREIIRKIIPTYKEFLNRGQIEVSVSPYYHAILPLLIDKNSAKESSPNVILPDGDFEFYEDAEEQIKLAIDKCEGVFGKKPSGIWCSEQCVSDETLKLLSKNDIKWTVGDESVLANSIQTEFTRDFRGILENPYNLTRLYESNGVKILFRDSVLANLIGFEYGNHPQKGSANDLYDRIKIIQSKLENSPNGNNHIITIAMDGENCWETYSGDGHEFLRELYTLLSDDDSIDVTTVGEFAEKVKKPVNLDKISAGSWIKGNFNIWIGEPVKNIAWNYLSRTRKYLKEKELEGSMQKDLLESAKKEIFIAEGSDWFWWYGEPNDSGRDDIFDNLFRNRLKNVYKFLNEDYPEYLDYPLEMFLGKPTVNIKGIFTPEIDGMSNEDEWALAGCIDIPASPMYDKERFVNRICFGNDNDNIYFKFDLNKGYVEKCKKEFNLNEIYIYFYLPQKNENLSYIRPKLKHAKDWINNRYMYNYEVEFIVSQGNFLPPFFSKVNANNLWEVNFTEKLEYAYEKVVELKVPFNSIGIEVGQKVEFIIITSKSQVLQDIFPKNQQLAIIRT